MPESEMRAAIDSISSQPAEMPSAGPREYVGNILPLAKNLDTGEMRLAVPRLVSDVAETTSRGFGELLGYLKNGLPVGENISPEAFSALMLLTPEAAIGGATSVLKAAPTKGSVLDAFRTLTQSGRKKLLEKYQNRLLENAPRGKVISALENAPEFVRGSKPTAGEALAAIPEATGIAAHQKNVSKIPGVSAQFSARTSAQQEARKSAISGISGTADDLAKLIEERDAVTAPMREAALAAANEKGVNTPGLLAKIAALTEKPGIRASDVARKTLVDLREKISALTDKKLKINADDLYMVRKEAGNIVAKFAQENQNFDKRFTAGLTSQVQKMIDDSIEAAAGPGYREYLKKYSDMSKPIDQMIAGQELESGLTSTLGKETPARFGGKLSSVSGLSETQKTVGGDVLADLQRKAAYETQAGRTKVAGGDVGTTLPHLPNLLSRPAMAVNFVLRLLGKDAVGKIEQAAAIQYLDHELLAAALKEAGPQLKESIRLALAYRAATDAAMQSGRHPQAASPSATQAQKFY